MVFLKRGERVGELCSEGDIYGWRHGGGIIGNSSHVVIISMGNNGFDHFSCGGYLRCTWVGKKKVRVDMEVEMVTWSKFIKLGEKILNIILLS